MDTLPRFCRYCNLMFGSAEKRVMVGQSAFHEDCFVKHLRAQHPTQNHKPPVVKRKSWAWPSRVH